MIDRNGDKHRANTEGLRPAWQPGQSGNPAGRPRRKTFTELACDYLGESCADDTAETRMQRLVRTIVDRAMAGDRAALGELLSRIDPAPRHSLTINHPPPGGVSGPDAVLATLRAMPALAHSKLSDDVCATLDRLTGR